MTCTQCNEGKVKVLRGGFSMSSGNPMLICIECLSFFKIHNGEKLSLETELIFDKKQTETFRKIAEYDPKNPQSKKPNMPRTITIADYLKDEGKYREENANFLKKILTTPKKDIWDQIKTFFKNIFKLKKT